MSPDQERKVLRALLRRMDTSANSFLHGNLFLVVLWFPIAFIFGLGSHLTQARQLHPVFLCLVSAIVGALVFWVFLRRAGERSWPTVKRYLDRQRIDARIRELEHV